MRLKIERPNPVRALCAAAAVAGWLAGGVAWAAGHGQDACTTGCTQPGHVAACGPAGRGPHGCRHGLCHHGHGCFHGHCGRHCGPCGTCGHPVGGPCSHGYSGGLLDGCKTNAWEKRYFLRSQGKAWHSTWYDPAEGRPIALVVPPTAEFQTQYSWGVPSSRVAPIYHQFRRPYPGPGGVAGGGPGGFVPTPNQPSDTVQFGVHAVRGPWGGY